MAVKVVNADEAPFPVPKIEVTCTIDGQPAPSVANWLRTLVMGAYGVVFAHNVPHWIANLASLELMNEDGNALRVGMGVVLIQDPELFQGMVEGLSQSEDLRRDPELGGAHLVRLHKELTKFLGKRHEDERSEN